MNKTEDRRQTEDHFAVGDQESSRVSNGRPDETESETDRTESTCSQQAVRFNKRQNDEHREIRTSCIVVLSDTSKFNSKRSISLSPWFFPLLQPKDKNSLERQTEDRPDCCPPSPFRPTRDLFRASWFRPVGDVYADAPRRQRARLADDADLSFVFLFFFSPEIAMISLASETPQDGTRLNWKATRIKFFHGEREKAISKNTCVEHSRDCSYWL